MVISVIDFPLPSLHNLNWYTSLHSYSTLQRTDLILAKKLFISKNMQMQHRLLFWTALVCATVFSMVAQAQVTAMPSATPANGYQLTPQKCRMPGCTCPCCKHTGSKGAISSCGCPSVSLVCLPATGADEPLHRSSANYATFINAIPKIITADIFRPPQA